MEISVLYYYPEINIWTMPISVKDNPQLVEFIEIDKKLAIKLLQTGEFDGPVTKNIDVSSLEGSFSGYYYIQFRSKEK